MRPAAAWLVVAMLVLSGVLLAACGAATDEADTIDAPDEADRVDAPDKTGPGNVADSPDVTDTRRPTEPVRVQEPSGLILIGGELPASSPPRREVVEIQAWSESALLASATLQRWATTPPRRFTARPRKDDPAQWVLQRVPDGTRLICMQRKRAGDVVSVARPIRILPAATEPLRVEWVPEHEMAFITCMAYFAGRKEYKTCYVVRWDGLPLPTNGCGGYVSRLAVPGGTEVEIACSGWRRGSDYGLPAPLRTRQAAGTTGGRRFELPSGHALLIGAVEVDGRKIPSRVRTWRLGEDGAYHPWSGARSNAAALVSVQVLPGRYGALVQTLEGGSGWKTFLVERGTVGGQQVEVPVQERGPRIQITFKHPAGARDKVDMVRLDRVGAQSPAGAAFWRASTRASAIKTGPLPHGEYDMLVRCGPAWWTRRIRVDGAGPAAFEFEAPQSRDPRLPSSGSDSLVVVVLSPTKARAEGAWAVLSSLDHDDGWGRARAVSSGKALFTRLGVGRYRASVRPTWNLPFVTTGVSKTITLDGKGPQKHVKLSPPGVAKRR